MTSVPVGLCLSCAHHRVTGNRRGSTFHMCTLAATDPRFRKYPPLPVRSCTGYRTTGEDGSAPADPVGDPDVSPLEPGP